MVDSKDFIKELGALGLGSRLRRLSDRLNESVTRIYRDQEVVFEPYWFPIVYLLHKQKELSVTEIAEILQLTHPAIIHTVKKLTKQGYLKSRNDKSDRRRNILSLSAKGRSAVKKLLPIWKHIHKKADELLNEADINLLAIISQIESTLDEKELYERFYERQNMRKGGKK
jgi:DNA-binding MarR family transcriptional regulator